MSFKWWPLVAAWVLACVLCAAPAGGQTFDWSGVGNLNGNPGIKLVTTTWSNLNVRCVQLDTGLSSMRFYTTERHTNYVEGRRETKAETTATFVANSQNTARKVLVAINASEFEYDRVYPEDGTDWFCDLVESAASLGQPVSYNGGTAFVVGMDGVPTITNLASSTDVTGMKVAVAGQGPVVQAGIPYTVAGSRNYRSCIGVSQDKRYVYFQVIQNATDADNGHAMKYFGAYNAVQMDGGGSSEMATWNGASASVYIGTPRKVGNSVGVYFNNASPSLACSASSLSNTCRQGKNAYTQKLEIWNAGGSNLAYAVASDAAWLTVTPTNGVCLEERDAVQVSYASAGLAAGTYMGTFTISATEVTNSPQTVAVTLTVLPPGGNLAPVAVDQAVRGVEDSTRAIQLSAMDPDGDTPLAYSYGQPAHGTVSGTAPNVTYTPVANYYGPDAFTFTASDGQATSSLGTVDITVDGINEAPVAQAQAVTTPEDTAVAITLSAFDLEGDPLEYSFVSQPTNGTLSGMVSNVVIYTPATNYSGPDAFTFRVKDGIRYSGNATVTITVTPVNDPPTLTRATAMQTSWSPSPLTVNYAAVGGADVDGDTLAYVWTFGDGGSGIGAAVSHTYAATGSYTATVEASDGNGCTATASVTMVVSDGGAGAAGGVETNYTQNGIKYRAHIFTNVGESSLVVSSGGDVEYLVVAGGGGGGTRHGGGGGAGGFLTGNTNVSCQTYYITVGAGGAGGISPGDNNLKYGSPGSNSAFGTITAFGGGGGKTDNGGNANGGSGGGGSLNDMYGGTGTVFQGCNGGRGSWNGAGGGGAGLPGSNGTYNVSGRGGAGLSSPLASGIPAYYAGGGGGGGDGAGTSGYLGGVGGVGGGGHGGDWGIGRSMSAGTDGTGGGGGSCRDVSNNVSGARGGSGIVIVRYITEPPSNQMPVADNQSVTNVSEDTAKAITLTATDAEGDTLTYSILARPAHGALSGTPPNVTYTPATNFNGLDSFTFKVNDTKADSLEATVSLTVLAVNDAPVAQSQSVTTTVNTAQTIALAATDVDGDALTYSIVAQPSHGAVTGTPPYVVYTPATNYTGADAFTFKAYDGKLYSGVTNVSLLVLDAFEAWRRAVFSAEQLTNATISGADADPDYDGLTNEHEWRAGTDPTNAASCLVITTITQTPLVGGKFVLRWQSVSGRTYTVEMATNLLSGFGNLTNLPATPVMNVYTDNVGDANGRFYRIVVEAQ